VKATNADPPNRSTPSRTAWSVVRALAFIVLSTMAWRVWVRPTIATRDLEARKPSAPQSLQGMHVLGSHRATVGLVVFSDFECPVCATFARDVLPVITSKYVSRGQVLLAFSDLPLESIHPSAVRLSAIAECAGEQNLFWQVHDRLFAAQGKASVEREAAQILDPRALQTCLETRATTIVRQRLSRASALGLTGTPSLWIGTIKDKALTVTDAMVGLQAVKKLEAALDRRLAR
jgi:protein-disulfide isomerase